MLKITKKLAFSAALSLGVLAAPAMADTVKIGFTGPLSGGAAVYGQNALYGMKMAADEINAAGGFAVDGKKYTFEIVSLDDKYAPSQAAVNAKRMVQRDKVKVVFTPHSGGVNALKGFNEKSDFMLMAYTSVPGIEDGNDLTFRIPPNFEDYIAPYTEFTLNEHGKKIAIVSGTHDYARMWVRSFVPAWEADGGEVVANNPMDYNKSADFYTGVSRALAKQPDALLIGGPSEPSGLVAQQARQLGFTGGFVFMEQAKIDEMEQVVGSLELFEGSVGNTPLSVLTNPGAIRFIEKYKAAKKDENALPAAEIGYHYMTIHLLAKAMHEAGTVVDTQRIAKALDSAAQQLDDKYNTYDVHGVDDEGGFVLAQNVAVVRDGKIVPYISEGNNEE